MSNESKTPKGNKRVLALDYGRVHTGAAVSDVTRTIVRPLPDIDKALNPDGLRRVAELVAGEGAGLVVVGLPRSLSGSLSGQARETLEFVQRLSRHLDVQVKTWDERFSSKIASRRGRFSNASKHSLAACVILEEFMASSGRPEGG